jgi:transmembrane sensor
MSDLDKYKDLLNHDSEEEKDEFATFLNKSGKANLPKGRGKDAIWDAIEKDIQDVPKSRKTIKPWIFVGLAAAVSLIVSLSILFNSDPEIIYLTTGLAESTQTELPDGSIVTLNAGSTISYSEEWNRELTLEGEAFFEVTKGDRFIVTTRYGNVEVLGTSFNVFARDDQFVVACKTGKVQVTIPSKTFNQAITPGQIVSMKSDTVKQIQRIPELMGKWQSGEFYYDKQPFSQVVFELQRQFNIEIDFDDSKQQMFSGYFTNKNVETALDMVCLPLGYRHEKTGESSFVISENE